MNWQKHGITVKEERGQTSPAEPHKVEPPKVAQAAPDPLELIRRICSAHRHVQISIGDGGRTFSLHAYRLPLTLEILVELDQLFQRTLKDYRLPG
jgi:hypothetical protein